MLGEDIIYSLKHIEKDDLLSFFKHNTEDFPNFFYDEITIPYAEKLSKNAEFVIACEQGQIIGMIAFYMNIKPMCYLSFVCVLPNGRGMGVFSKMLSVIENKAKKEGFFYIRLEVAHDNIVARNVYERKGFVDVGQSLRGYYMEKVI